MTTINIDAAWLAGKTSPYPLAGGSTYVLQSDVTTPGTAFGVAGANTTLDLNGHTVTYDDAVPIDVINGGFEAGDLTGWDVSAAPGASVVPARLGFWGRWMARVTGITSTQTIRSSPVAIPAAGVPYIASVALKGTASMTVVLSVVDTVTGAVLYARTGTGNAVSTGSTLIAWFTPTTANPVRLAIAMTAASGTTASLDLDYVQVARNGDSATGHISGVDMTYRSGITVTSSVLGGRIVQGKAGSYLAHPLMAYAANGVTVTNIEVHARGLDTYLFNGNYAGNVTIRNNTFVGEIDQISNRMAACAVLYLSNGGGVFDIQDNTLTGVHQNGIVLSSGYETAAAIVGNTITLDSRWTDGYAIGLQMVRNFEVANNTVRPRSGRGIMLQATNATDRPMSDGTIRDNTFEVQEQGNVNMEFGPAGLEATAFRFRNYSGTIKNIHVYNNVFSARTGVGQDWAAIGARFSVFNDKGQMNGCNFVFEGNTCKAVVAETDPGLRYQDAYALDLARFDAGTGMVFRGNTMESNDISMNFGSNDGINESDITFTGDTLVKSSEGIATIRSNDGTVRGYVSIEAGGFGSTVKAVRLIDLAYAGGATATIKYVGPGIKDIVTSTSIACVLDGSGDLTATGTVSGGGVEGECVLDGAGDLAGEGAARWRFIVYDPVPY